MWGPCPELVAHTVWLCLACLETRTHMCVHTCSHMCTHTHKHTCTHTHTLTEEHHLKTRQRVGDASTSQGLARRPATREPAGRKVLPESLRSSPAHPWSQVSGLRCWGSVCVAAAPQTVGVRSAAPGSWPGPERRDADASRSPRPRPVLCRENAPGSSPARWGPGAEVQAGVRPQAQAPSPRALSSEQPAETRRLPAECTLPRAHQRDPGVSHARLARQTPRFRNLYSQT